MNDAERASFLIAAMEREAKGARLIAITLEFVAPGAPARVATQVSRETRTLLFLDSEAFDASGARLASASAIYEKDGA